MSSVTSFKQQCPSCGGQITIKNSDLIGKKVDCPKCKHRFVVESPDGSGPHKAAKAETREKKKPRDRDEDRQPGKKKKGGKGLLIFGGIAVVVIAVVGIILAMTLGGDDKLKTNPNPKPGPQAGKDDTPAKPQKGVWDRLDEEGPDRDKARDELWAQIESGSEKDPVDKLKDRALAGNGAAKTLLDKIAGSDKAELKDVKDKAKSASEDVQKQFAANNDPREDPTNMLPNATQVVFSVPVEKFLRSSLSTAIFIRGAFQQDDFAQRIGVPLTSIDRIVLGGDRRNGSSVFAVIRTRDGFNWDEVKRVMHLDPKTVQKVKGKEYFLGRVDFLNEFVGGKIPLGSLRSKAAVHRRDERTLVFGDEATVKQWLDSPPEFVMTNLTAPSTGGPGSGPPSGGPPSGYPNGGPPSGYPGGGPPSGSGGPPSGYPGGGPPSGSGGPPSGYPSGGPPSGYPSGGPPSGSGGPPSGYPSGGPPSGYPSGGPPSGNQGKSSPGAGAGVPPGVGAGPGAGVPPGVGQGGGQGTEGRPSGGPPNTGNLPQVSGTYLTVNTKLHQVIERAEYGKQPLILFAEQSDTESPIAGMNYLDELDPLQKRQINTVALALHLDRDLVLRVVAACRDKHTADPIKSEIEKIFTRVAKEELLDATGIRFAVGAPAVEPGSNQPGAGPGGYPGGYPGGGARGSYPGSGPGRGYPGGGGPGQGYPRGPGGGGTAPPSLPSAPGGGGMAPPSLPGPPTGGRGEAGAGSRGVPPPGYGAPGEAAPPAPTSFIDVSRQDEFITIVVTVTDKIDPFIESRVAARVIRLRGDMDMNSNQLRLGDLAVTSNLFRDAKQGLFPFGAFPRQSDQTRGWRPYPADDRVSWLRELLPYMGDDRYLDLYDAVKTDRSWRDPENVKIGRILVPQFTHPGSGHFYVKARGVDVEMAVTHFVGMAGVGPDAPYYAKTDPRAGIFGYDRQAAAADVKDGLSNTIYMIQTDPAVAGPWIRGGGATVRGTSAGGDRDVGQRGGFISPNHDGKAGAWVLMGDGSARFLTKDIAPEVFKALCTMAGGESVDIDAIAPKVQIQPVQSKRGAAAAAPPKAEKKPEDTEEAPAKPAAKPSGDAPAKEGKKGNEEEAPDKKKSGQ